jgi:hypothetical protein
MSQGLHLSVEIGSITTEPVPRAVIEALTEVQVRAAATSQSGFQMKLAIGKRSEVMRLLSSGYFDPQRRVIITAIVRGTPHVLMDGVITQQDLAPSEQAGASTLSITGLDLTAHMDFVDLTGVPYPGLPQNVIVTAVLAKYALFGVVPVVFPPIIPVIKNPLKEFTIHQGTDLAFVQSMARETGYVFYLEPGPRKGMSQAYWGPEIRRGTPQPALSIDLDAASNVESLSFSYNGLARQQLVATILNEETKFPIPIPVPEVTLLKPFLAAQPAAIMKTRNLRVASFSAAEGLQIALGALAGPADAVTGSGQLDVLRYGRLLSPRKLVTVRGAGAQFNGRYYVTSVTHNIRRGQYTQSFSLARGGVKSDVSRVTP